MEAPAILALGEAMVEFNQAGGAGSREYLQGFGGDTSNFAIAAARQGASAGYLSALGDDDHGRLLRALWDREGVDHAGVATDPQAATGIYFVRHDARGHHFSFLRAGSAASRMTPAGLPRERIAAARLLHLSGISLALSARRATRRMRRSNAPAPPVCRCPSTPACGCSCGRWRGRAP